MSGGESVTFTSTTLVLQCQADIPYIHTHSAPNWIKVIG